MKEESLVKVQTYCPKDKADELRLVIGKAGGGEIGRYTHCSFVSEGDGYFLPQKGANPFIGRVGEIEKVKEVKIEFVCRKSKLKEVTDSLKKAHPYEEVPIEIYELLDAN